jgi:hypothetical protein
VQLSSVREWGEVGGIAVEILAVDAGGVS